jgi:hypothetical protein
MRNRTFSLVLTIAAAGTSAALGLFACSSSSTTTGDTNTGTDSGSGGNTKDGTTGTGNTDAGTQDMTDSGTQMGTDSGGGGTCTNPPALFPPGDAGLYCPYDYGPDGGGAAHCKTGTEMCCLSPSSDAGSSVCEAVGASCTQAGFGVWQCSSPAECPGATPVCCLTAGPPEADPNCSGYQKTKGFDSTTCMAAGKCTGTVVVGKYTDNLMVVCETQADCTTGTCTAVKTSGTSIGLCL